jgi:hypothetical protein
MKQLCGQPCHFHPFPQSSSIMGIADHALNISGAHKISTRWEYLTVTVG